MCTTMLLQLVAQLDLQVFPFFCLITELLLSLANHAKVVTESVLFQKISTSHRKRCQNEQEGKDYLKAKHIWNLVKCTETRTGITCFANFWWGPVPRSSYTPATLNNLYSSKNWILRVKQIRISNFLKDLDFFRKQSTFISNI